MRAWLIFRSRMDMAMQWKSHKLEGMNGFYNGVELGMEISEWHEASRNTKSINFWQEELAGN